MKLYVGTFTRPADYLAASNGEGLYVFDYDVGSGHVALVQKVTGIENPSFLCLSPDGRFLHAVWEVPEWPEGLIGSYAVSPADGTLSYLGIQGSKGAGPSYVTMDSRGRALLVSDYGSGRVALLPSGADGSLMEATSVQQHHGSGPNAARQEGPHAHCIVVSPDDAYAFSADLGADRVFGYRLDYDRFELVPHTELKLASGSGPRHLVFAPGSQHAYLICELDATVAALGYDAVAGTLAHIETYPLLPADGSGENISADIRVHPSGRFVYGSNRGHDSITMFAIDPTDGRLQRLGHRSTEGATPRNFAISPDGRFLLVANQDSDTVVTMPIDQETGLLGETVAVASVPTPVCLRFARD
jgi:6-phosphogluconolactonase